MPAGRPRAITPEIAEEYFRRIAEGEGESEICRDAHMPNASTFWRHRDRDEDFRTRYAQAREQQGHTYADRVVEEAFKAVDGESAQAARARIDALKWAASKRLPKVYGDKTQITGEGGGPVQFETIATGVPRADDAAG